MTEKKKLKVGIQGIHRNIFKMLLSSTIIDVPCEFSDDDNTMEDMHVVLYCDKVNVAERTDVLTKLRNRSSM